MPSDGNRGSSAGSRARFFMLAAALFGSLSTMAREIPTRRSVGKGISSMLQLAVRATTQESQGEKTPDHFFAGGGAKVRLQTMEREIDPRPRKGTSTSSAPSEALSKRVRGGSNSKRSSIHNVSLARIRSTARGVSRK